MVWMLLGVMLCGAQPPAPAWEWKAADASDQRFDGKRSLELPELAGVYDPGDGFTVEIRCKPAKTGRLEGLVSDYAGSREGGWYLSTGEQPPHTRPRVVLVGDQPESYRGFNGSAPLKPGEWQTLTLVYSGTRCALYLDGKKIGEQVGEHPPLAHAAGQFAVGRRAQSFFHGEIASVRLWAEALPMPEEEETAATGAVANYLANSSFETGQDVEDLLLWHRMSETDAGAYEVKGWEIDSGTAFHGKRSLKGVDASPLILMEEVWEKMSRSKPWIFSVYLKADREGVACELGAGMFWRLDEKSVSKTVRLTTEWKRYELVADHPKLYRRGTTIQGPVALRVTPEHGATVWVDAAQWSPQAGEYVDHRPGGATGEAPPVHYPATASISRPAGKGSWSGSVPLRVHRAGSGGERLRLPVTLGVPFNRGSWDGKGTLKLVNPEGKAIEVQSEVLTEWKGDRGVQVLGLFFTDELAPGWHDYTLEVTPEAETPAEGSNGKWRLVQPTSPGELWSAITGPEGQPLFKSGSLRGIGVDGTVYDSRLDREAQWKPERTGALYQVYRSSGRLMDEKGHALLAYVARVHCWRDLPGVKLEVSLVNTRESGSVPLRTLYWQTHAADGSAATTLLAGEQEAPANGKWVRSLFYQPSGRKFLTRQNTPSGETETPGREPLFLKAKTGERTVVLQAPEAWQRHPSEVAWEEGEWRGYLWPDEGARGLLFPRGLALNREFWLRESTSGDEAAWESEPVAMAAPSWWATTDVLISFFAGDRERFPLAEKMLDTHDLLRSMSDAAVEASRAYGVFDFGDTHGDGGWGNLESFRDWAAMLGGLRVGDEASLATGLHAARHYRDIDINQATGACYVHNLNHVTGSIDMSHAWPGGVLAHYLLTGSKRSEEVVLLHGEYLLGLKEEELAKGLRSLGRYLTNLADLYQLTGDDRFRDRFFEQVRASRKLLAEDKNNPDRSIFSYLGHSEQRRLVPFHAWYGISALQKMESLTGDPELSAFIAEEIAATLNPELYALDLKELWPGIAEEKGAPLMLSTYAQHRGSFFYPVLIAQALRHARPADARLALESFYVGAVEGRGGGRVETILSSAALKGTRADEKENDLIASAQALLWKAAADNILNGDFSLSRDAWPHWRPYPGKSLSYHTNWQERRKKFVTLDEAFHKTGERSLRFNLAPVAFQDVMKVDTNRFRIPAGKHCLKGWVRWDDGALAPVIALEASDLNGNFAILKAACDTRQFSTGRLNTEQKIMKGDAITLDPPDEQGWRRVEITFTTPRRAVGNLLVSTGLKEHAQTGHLWIDGFIVEPVGQP